MILWRDEVLDEKEILFLNTVGENLKLTAENIIESSISIEYFIQVNKADIPYFQFAHPIKKFYKQVKS